MTITGSDEPTPVRVELLENWVDAPGGATPPEPDPKRIGPIVGLIGILAMLGLVWWLARPEAGRDAAADPIIAPTITTIAASTTEIPTSTTEPPEPAIIVGQLDGLVTQVVRSAGVTLVVEAGPPIGYPSLLRSEDGIDFEDVADPFAPERLLAIAAVEGGFAALTGTTQPPISSVVAPEPGRVSTHFSPDGQNWTKGESQEISGPTLGVIDDTGWSTVAPVGVDAPDPFVSALLADYVDRDAADATCEMRNSSGVTEDQRFELYDCTGALVGEAWVSVQQADAMWFATEILRGPFAVTSPEVGPIELPRGSYAITAVPTSAGPVVLLVDFYPVLRSEDSPYDAFRFSLARVDPAGVVEVIPVPTAEGFDPQVELRSLRGDLAYEWDGDLYVRSVDGSSDWRAYAAPRSGQTIGVTMDGNDVVMIDRGNRDVWVLHPDGDWRELMTEGRGIDSVLYVASDHSLVLSERGEVVRVPVSSEVVASAAEEQPVDPRQVAPVRRPLGDGGESPEVIITSRGDGEGFVGLTRTASGIALLADPVASAEALATDLDPSFVPRELRGDGQGLVVWGDAPDGGRFDLVLTSATGSSWDLLELDLPAGIDRFVIDDVSRTETTLALLAQVGGNNRQLLLWRGSLEGDSTVLTDRPCNEPSSCVITSVLALPDGILALHGVGGGAWLDASVWKPDEGWSTLPTQASWTEGDVLARSSARLRPRQPGRRDPRGGALRPYVLTDEWAGLLSLEDGTIEKLWDAPIPGGRFDGVGKTGLVAAYVRPDSVYVYSDRTLQWTRYPATGLVLDELMAVAAEGALYLARSTAGTELVLFPAVPDQFDP